MNIIDQRAINFLQMLEAMFRVDIKTKADFAEIRQKWDARGRPIDLSLIRNGKPQERKREVVHLKPMDYEPRFDF